VDVTGSIDHPFLDFAGTFEGDFWDEVFDQIDNRHSANS
jgi:hypothetical protein